MQESFYIAIYGYGNHGLRLKNIIRKITNNNNKYVIIGISRRKLDDTDVISFPSLKSAISRYGNIDCVFISTPNESHLDSFKDCIANKIKSIYVEKPAIGVEEYCKININKIKSIINYIQVGYHLNYEEGFIELKDYVSNEKMGSLLRLDMYSGHGLAFKNTFNDSWRAKSKSAIVQTVACHLINISFVILGDTKINNSFAYVKRSNENGYYDTCHLSGLSEGGVLYSLSATWGSPFQSLIKAYFSNGIWTYDFNKGNVTIESPRDIFDKLGYFIAPDASTHQSKPNGLTNSVKYFLNKSFLKKSFDYEFNNASLTSSIVDNFNYL